MENFLNFYAFSHFYTEKQFTFEKIYVKIIYAITKQEKKEIQGDHYA